MAESSGQKSSATSEKDTGNNNERAQKDHPEAPGPVIGMNDERGGVGSIFLVSCLLGTRDIERKG